MAARKVTPPSLETLACDGLVRLVFFRGRYRGSWRRPDDSALLRLLRDADRALRRAVTAIDGW